MVEVVYSIFLVRDKCVQVGRGSTSLAIVKHTIKFDFEMHFYH